MKTRIKTLALSSILLAGVVSAGAQEKEYSPRHRPMRKPAEFNCPTCGSPCVNKAELRHQMQQRRFENRDRRQPTPEQIRHRRRHAFQRFDVNDDGQLSNVERASMRAHRQAMHEKHGYDAGQPGTSRRETE